MSIIRIIVLAACAYAGSAVATIQFPDLPDPIKWRRNNSGVLIRS
jgi:hypothetical protein